MAGRCTSGAGLGLPSSPRQCVMMVQHFLGAAGWKRSRQGRLRQVREVWARETICCAFVSFSGTCSANKALTTDPHTPGGYPCSATDSSELLGGVIRSTRAIRTSEDLSAFFLPCMSVSWWCRICSRVSLAESKYPCIKVLHHKLGSDGKRTHHEWAAEEAYQGPTKAPSAAMPFFFAGPSVLRKHKAYCRHYGLPTVLREVRPLVGASGARNLLCPRASRRGR
jgi:hypothetical protein